MLKLFLLKRAVTQAQFDKSYRDLTEKMHTCDDGEADSSSPDHMYRIEISEDGKSGTVVLEKTFDDVTRQGEIEGLTFDSARQEFLLLYNRGARIIAGMPSGFYEGYDHEIHEVFVYEMK